MKLNAGIIYDCLQDQISVHMFGRSNDKLHIGRPRFYTGIEKSFEANRLYIARADRLPQRPHLHKDAVILCIGDSQQLSTYKERCCVIQLDSGVDFLSIANRVHEIFDRYDAWNESLYEILNSTANIKDMLACSKDIFSNPLFVINSDFSIIACTEYKSGDLHSILDQNGTINLSLPSVAQFLEQNELSMHVKEPLLVNILDSSTLNTNLFKNEDYIGCFTIDYLYRRYRTSDSSLAKHLSSLIGEALKNLSSASIDDQGLLKDALKDIIDGVPTTTEQNRALEASRLNNRYVCVKFKLGNSLTQLPIGYICNEVERTFPHSIAFQYETFVVGFVEFTDSDEKTEDSSDTLKESLSTFIRVMDIFVGVSACSDNFFKAHLYYRQASAALDIGDLLFPGERYFDFEQLALSEMLINSLGELPVDMYYTSGMRRLIEHDVDSHVSYIDTLRVYLNNNMNISKTASDLYVHRSTLMERISRIERELAIDLHDPDERLRIQMLLKALQIHDQIRGSLGSLVQNQL